MQLLLSHLTGNANVKAAAYGFLNASLLREFHVSLATYSDNTLGKLSYLPAFSELRRRQFKDELRPYTRTWPWLEIARVILPKLKLSSLISNPNAPFHIDKICQNFDRRVAARILQIAGSGLDAIYGYEDLSGFSFREAKARGIACLYDLPIGYWKAANHLMESEKDRCPDYFKTIIGFNQSETKLARKEEELSLADTIYVASTFTAKTLSYYGGSLAPVKVIPYGFPPVTKQKALLSHYDIRKRKIKLLFVGSLSQRKGIAEIFSAVKIVKDYVELTIIGTRAVDDCEALNAELNKHTWIPSMPHDKILETMREHDVLLFPSLFEGFGLVITEAMSQGTPVITTNRTAGPDIIEHKVNGWIIEPGSTEALLAILNDLIADPSIIADVGREAIKTAERRPWEQYGYELACEVSKTKVK